MFPLVFAAFFAVGMTSVTTGLIAREYHTSWAISCVVSAVAGLNLALWWYYRPLTRVFLDADSLLVSNYFWEESIALADIKTVTQNPWLNSRPVWITFRRETRFGHRIVFLSDGWPRPFWREDPIVGKLQRHAESARRRLASP